MIVLFFILYFVLPVQAVSHTARELQDEFSIDISGENSNIPSTAPVILNEKQDIYPLGLYLEIFEDPSGKLTIEEITSSEFENRFVPNQNEVPNFGHTNSAYWVRFRIRNETGQSESWRLKMGFANMQYVDLYLQRLDNKGYTHKKTGTYLPFHTRDIFYPSFVFKIPIEYGAGQTIYMHFLNNASMTLPLTLFSTEAFTRESQKEQLIAGFFYGILFFIFCYGLVVFLLLHDKSYLYYFLFVAGFILLQASYDGLASQYLWPDHAFWNHFAFILLNILVIFFALKFTSEFLQTKNLFPVFHKNITILLVLCGIVVLMIPIFRYGIVIRMAEVLSILSAIIILVTGILIWKKKYRQTRYFMIAVLAFLVSSSILEMVRLGILPSNTFTEHAYQVGIVILVFLLSLALVDRINILKKEKDELVLRQTKNLEEEVDKRTKALKESEEKYRNVVERANDTIAIVQDYKIKFINDKAVDIFGYKPEEVINTNFVKFVHKDMREELFTRYKRRFAGEETGNIYESKLIHKNGNTMNVLVSGGLIEYEGKPAALMIIHDITKLKKNQEYLQELNASKDKFFSIISHDLRSPFNSILGFSELLWKNSGDFSKAEIEKIAYDIYKTGNETIDLLNNLLEWSSSQTGKIKIYPENFFLKSVVGDTIDLLNEFAIKKNITVLNEVPGQIKVFADKNMISSVIRNLLSNAIKFTQSGNVRITAKNVNGFVEFSITDTGVGIEPEDIKKLFRLDTEFSTSGTANEKGSGLGLILCKEFIEKNHGEIYVESEKGKGTGFMFKLPATSNFD